MYVYVVFVVFTVVHESTTLCTTEMLICNVVKLMLYMYIYTYICLKSLLITRVVHVHHLCFL